MTKSTRGVSRRAVLVTGGTGLVTGLAGCQFRDEDDEEPRPSLQSGRAYQVAADQLVAVLDFSKPDEDEAYTVPLRWEVGTADLSQVTHGTVHLRGNYPTPTVSMAFMSSIKIDRDTIYRSELFRGERTDPWISLPVNQGTYYAAATGAEE